MATNPIPKLNWKLVQQMGRRASNKVDLSPVVSRLTGSRSSEDNSDAVSRDHSIHGESTIRYNVCKDRSKLIKKFTFDRRNVQKKLAGLQDEYDLLPPEEPNQQKQAPANKQAKGYREFAASKTYKNVTLPLKSSKLANPFPEPVKLMPSHKVSDQEKADQMLAEFKIPKFSNRK